MIEPINDIDVVIIFLGESYVKSAEIFNELNEDGVRYVYDASDSPIANKLAFAEKQKSHYVMFVDDKELSDGVFAIKNVKSGKVSKHSIQRIVSIVKDHRANEDFKKPV